MRLFRFTDPRGDVDCKKKVCLQNVFAKSYLMLGETHSMLFFPFSRTLFGTKLVPIRPRLMSFEFEFHLSSGAIWLAQKILLPGKLRQIHLVVFPFVFPTRAYTHTDKLFPFINLCTNNVVPFFLFLQLVCQQHLAHGDNEKMV